MDTFNVFNTEIRNRIKKHVDFAPGAWVEFFDDVTIGSLASVAEDKDFDIKTGLQILVDQISDWNFADKDGKKLDINVDNLSKLTSKFLIWIRDQEKEILNSEEKDNKKKD